jgi:regulatory protein
MGFRRTLETEQEIYDYAIQALARRMRSVAELKRLLRGRLERENKLAPAIVERVTRRLKEQGYLNDARYASAYAEFRRDNEKFGPGRISLDLRSRGVHRELVEKAVAGAFAAMDEEKQARAYLRRKRIKKPNTQTEAARIFRQLRRAGFRTKAVFAILRKWDVAEETLEAFETESADSEG